jgi:hypothetical protein
MNLINLKQSCFWINMNLINLNQSYSWINTQCLTDAERYYVVLTFESENLSAKASSSEP